MYCYNFTVVVIFEAGEGVGDALARGEDALARRGYGQATVPLRQSMVSTGW